jgi:hypothetical protein
VKKRQVVAAAAKIGAVLEIGYCRWELIAPAGKLFLANGCHAYVVEHEGPGWSQQAYAELYDVLEEGLTPCDEPHCEICADAAALDYHKTGNDNGA